MVSSVFYSWQSDTDRKVNKNFIKDALQEAIAQVNSDLHVEDSERQDLYIDHDTKDIPGSPIIVDTIFNKIDQCGIFIADLTFVAMVEGKHGVSNPNVLTEKGYAIKAVGRNRIISVMNEAYGKAEKLPFDFKGQRWPILYTLHQGDSKEIRNTQKKLLVNKLKEAINSVINSGILTPNKKNMDEILKGYIGNPNSAPQFFDFLNEKANSIFSELWSDNFYPLTPYSVDELKQRIAKYESLLKEAISTVITGYYLGSPTHHKLWKHFIEHIINPGQDRKHTTINGVNTVWHALALYPTLLLLYAAGIASIATNNYDLLEKLLNDTMTRWLPLEEQQPIVAIKPWHIISERELTDYFPGTRSMSGYQLFSQKLHDTLRPFFRIYIPDDHKFEEYFYLFEYLHSLISINQMHKAGEYEISSNEYQSKQRNLWSGKLIPYKHQFNKSKGSIEVEINKKGIQHPLFTSGLFNNLDEFNFIKDNFK